MRRGGSMKINTEIIKALNPCDSRFNNYLSHYSDFDGILEDFILLDNISYNDKVWVFNRLATKEQNVKWSLLCASKMLSLFETEYTNDNRPRKALEAVEAYLDNPCDETRLVAKSAAEAARSAASAAEAAWLAARSAASAAASAWLAARSAKSAARSAASAARSAWLAARSAAEAAEAAWSAARSAWSAAAAASAAKSAWLAAAAAEAAVSAESDAAEEVNLLFMVEAIREEV